MNTTVLAAQAAQQGGGMGMIIMILAMFVIMYFFMIRPQQKQQKKIREFQNALKEGDKLSYVSLSFNISHHNINRRRRDRSWRCRYSRQGRRVR